MPPLKIHVQTPTKCPACKTSIQVVGQGNPREFQNNEGYCLCSFCIPDLEEKTLLLNSQHTLEGLN